MPPIIQQFVVIRAVSFLFFCFFVVVVANFDLTLPCSVHAVTFDDDVDT